MNKEKVTIVVIIMIFISIIGVRTYKEYSHNREVLTTYAEAEKQIEDGNYAGALKKLKGIEEDECYDTAALIELCNALISYEAGDVESAYWDLRHAKFGYLSLEQREKVDAFREELDLEYDKYLEQKKVADKKAYDEKVRNGVPFVGMSESDIARTTLKSPSSDVGHNYESINGEQYLANLYRFKEGENTIFTARCVQGKVIQIWDKRDEQPTTYKPNSSSSSKNDKKDDYDVYEYGDPEDFYYDNYEDFDGYEDAEDYWSDAWD